jgi:hypothetical protein
MTGTRRIPAILATLLLGVTLAATPNANADKPNGKARIKQGTTTVDRTRGADGLVDKTVTGPKGGTRTTDRYRGADGVVDATIVGPKGTTTVDRSKGADGLVDKTVTGPKGGTTVIDRQRGADGAVDATITKRDPDPGV